MDLGLTQQQVAGKIGVDPSCIVRWEKGEDKPKVEHIPLIIDLLGYIPFQFAADPVEKLQCFRMLKGLTYEKLGKLMRKNPEQLRGWLVGKEKPNKRSLEHIVSFLSDAM